MKNLKNILLIVLILTLTNNMFAYKWIGEVDKNNNGSNTDLRATANCEPPKTSTDIEINNVRFRINTGGDMWWDLQGKPRYEVPKGSNCHALYAGSIWVGGKDANGQLKIAAQRFRQVGIDFWAGPLMKDGSEKGNVSAEICKEYDKHFAINKTMVTKFRAWYNCSQAPDCDAATLYPGYSIPDTILNWPGNGPAGGYDTKLAPYYDLNSDGYYNPYDGDFPYYEYMTEGITDDKDCKRPRNRVSKLYGDYTYWWVYNDRGNIHTESKGNPIGMEFRSQAFCFATNDELNNMTFYNYNITNRSTYTLYNTYFGVWTDADLGNGWDDYVGCDVEKGLGYCYNGDDFDETQGSSTGYGSTPPAVGIDFFEGPYQDPEGIMKRSAWRKVGNKRELNCNVEGGEAVVFNGCINGLNFSEIVPNPNYGKQLQNGKIDTIPTMLSDSLPDNERWGMRRFLYFNNTGTGNPNTQDPEKAQDYYNYLIGHWKDDSPLYFNGTGHTSSGLTTRIETDFMFPGAPTTDKCNWGSKGKITGSANWSEKLCNNPPYDRRFVQSAGPFTLKPGAVNDITLGAVWARALSGDNWASVIALQKADEKAQTLFETCFRVLNGPDAPDIKIIELDQKLIFILSNAKTSNNYLEKYEEIDEALEMDDSLKTKLYTFQGYQVFQLKSKTGSISDRYDNTKAQLVFQSDIKDGVKKLVNYTWSDASESNVATVEVEGLDNGITHTFMLDKNIFNDGKPFTNNREYYFTVIAYGHNTSPIYNQNDINAFYGLKTPYIASRQNIKVYTAIPHRIGINGDEYPAEYGMGVPITMVEGYGNGNFEIDLSDNSLNQIMSGAPWHVRNNREYNAGKTPIGIKIINPLEMQGDDYTLKFLSNAENPYGVLGITGETYMAKKNKNGNIEVKDFNYALLNSQGDSVGSSLSFKYGMTQEEIFIKQGFALSFDLGEFAACYGTKDNSAKNGALSATIEFKDSLKRWIRFLEDSDGEHPSNWIHAGTEEKAIDNFFQDTKADQLFLDPDSFFEKMIVEGGNWAPYLLTNASKNNEYGHGQRLADSYIVQDGYKFYEGNFLSSIDFVFTADTSKWTRCCVIEMGGNPNYNIENADKFSLRRSKSVNKLGKEDGSGTHGMSWFPGYAIDVRTGERLNIAFGENSSLAEENGTDMIWNPSQRFGSYGKYLMFGGHYVYVFGNNIVYSTLPSDQKANAPLYDEGAYIHKALMDYEINGKRPNDLKIPYRSAMWVSIPYLNTSYLSSVLPDKEDWKDPLKFIQTDVKIKLRVSTPYTRGIMELEEKAPQNKNYPMFKFSTAHLSPTLSYNSKTAKNNLEGINVVPNPYYAFSTFEHEQLDTYIRITNLPKYYIIKIYNSNGSLVRTFDNKSGSNTYAPLGTDTYNSRYLEWDLKNENNIAIASGMYIIHVRAYDPNDKDKVLGDKILKWFGALRPVDLNNF